MGACNCLHRRSVARFNSYDLCSYSNGHVYWTLALRTTDIHLVMKKSRAYGVQLQSGLQCYNVKEENLFSSIQPLW